jgi:hypothetical protein
MQYTSTDFITRRQASTADSQSESGVKLVTTRALDCVEDGQAHAGMLCVQQLCVKAQQQEITEQQQYQDEHFSLPVILIDFTPG